MNTKAILEEKKKESSRAGAGDNSLKDHTTDDPGMETTKRKPSTIQEANMAEADKKLQVCPSGWRKITLAKGLKIY